MKTATLGQGRKILELIEETETPVEHLQKLIEGGYISDLLIANVDEMNRDEFRKACGLIPISTGFPVFKTIKLGTGLKNADDFRKAIADNGMKIGDWANGILGSPKFTVATEETELDLVVVTVAELGLKEGATREQIYARAKERGLDLCPAEVGPQLRLQHKDQPNGEWLIIAMDPIADSDGDLRLLSVGRADSDLCLYSCYGEPGSVWHSGGRFVFFPRKLTRLNSPKG